MKRYILPFVMLLCLCCFNSLFGREGRMLYIDSGLISYCQSLPDKNAAVELSVRNINSGEMRKDYLPVSLNPAYRPDSPSCLPHFPLAWSMSEKTLHIIFPNLYNDSIGRISFLIWVEEITMLNGNPSAGELDNVINQFKAHELPNNIMAYSNPHWLGGHLKTLSSCPNAVVTRERRQDTKILWYGLSDKNFIAYLPFANEKADTWKPCETPVKFQWMESRFSLRKGDIVRDEAILHSEDFPPDGFAPVGSVRIVGKRVLSDDPKAAFPQDAEWLIWESDGTAGRLCQMRGGRWSVCADAPRTDAPKVIVVNNDSNTVMLCYSIAIDAQDIAGSMQRITDLLKERGVLEAGGGRL